MTTDSLRQEATQRAKKVGISPDLMEMALRAERKDRPFIVEFESVVAGSFYRCTQEGPSKILYINTAHNFFTEGYMVPGSTRDYRDKLEIFLWILGTSELEADPEKAKIYQRERQIWSERLHWAFQQLAIINDHDSIRDFESMEEWEREAADVDSMADRDEQL